MNIIVSGSIAVDYLMRFPGHFTEHFLQDHLNRVSLSFLVEEMSRHWGGTAANISYTLGILGQKPRLFGTVGRDFPEYRQWLEAAGVDTAPVRQIDSVFCASFFVNTDLDNNQIASFYSGAMAYAKNYRLVDVTDGDIDYVVISPNDPTAMRNLAQECRDLGVPFMYDPSQQVVRLSGEELLQGLDGASTMIVNAYEAQLICDKTSLTIDDLRERLQTLVITQGADGSLLYSSGAEFFVPVVTPADIKDPTGVGDAYRAGLLCGMAYGLPLDISGRMGALCAAYVLEQVGPQNHRFSVAEYVARYRAHFDDEGALDVLLASVETA